MKKDYENMTDEQLIEQLRQGENDITDYILEKYKPLVRKKANAMYLIGGETDDLIQEGMIGLFKAIRDYMPGKEASFFHFAELCITRQLYTVVEASNRKKHIPLNTYISFSVEDKRDGISLEEMLSSHQMMSPEQMIIEYENERDFRQEIQKNLSTMEKKVFDYYLNGLNYTQIAKLMGKSPKSIDNALQRIRNKIKLIDNSID